MENQITKGKWQVLKNAPRFTIGIGTDDYSIAYTSVCVEDKFEPQQKANAQLIAEAGNVTQETGKTPRQLADENKMLMEALILAKDLIVKLAPDDFTEAMLIENAKEGGNFYRIIEAINKATK